MSKIENVVHNYLGKILTSNNDFRRGIYSLKNSSNFYAICQTADKLINVSKAYHKHFYGNPLPQTIDSVGVSRKNYFSENIKIEIDWFLVSLRKYRAEISIFLNYKKEFENSFLLGEYSKALDIVEKSIKQLGFSNWAISSKFLIFEYTSAQDKAKLLMSEVLEKNKEGVFTASLLNFISQKSERKLSAYKFDTDLKNAINNLKSNLNQSNKDYYNFQLNFFENVKYSELNDIMCFDYSNSIIDRYLTFRKIVFYSICNDIELEFIHSKLKYFLKKVPDDFFNTLCLFLNSDCINENYFDNTYLRLIDLYYTGQYDDLCKEVKKNIVNYPDNFTFINLYSRSLVFRKKNFIPIVEAPCLLNEIAENLFKIYKRTSNPVESLYSLYQISKNIDDFDINFQLNPYIKREQNNNCNIKYFYFSFPKADPLIFDMAADSKKLSKNIYDTIRDKTYQSISLKYKYNIINDDYESIEGICNTKYLIDKAKHIFDNKDYNASLPIWQEIYNENSETPPIYENAIEYIFRIYYETNKFDECIKWYVDSFIKNPFAVYKINTDEVQKALRKGRYKNVSINIYLPIFISLVSSDENEKCFTIELFCKINDTKYPTDLIKNDSLPKDAYLELFFYIGCNNETIKNYRHLNTTKRRLEERIEICNYLATIFPVDNERYIQELNLLTNELIIYEGIQKLDESKIYANDQAILNKELDEFEGLYNRYMTIAGLYFQNIKILTINKNELRFLNKKNEVEYSQNDIEYSEKAHFDAFISLFSVILERFLYSKFGIVTYLSTRIRHGVFLGELRPEFEKNNIIFFKNKIKDKYEPTSFWLHNNELSPTEKEKLTLLITNFSDKIDTLISRIIKENIQIKLNDENPKGWFDYEFTYEELDGHSVTLFYEDDYKKFCKKVLDILWERTDENLQEIRHLLLTDVKPQFIDIINNFESDVYKLLGKNKMSEIFTAISLCSTNIQNKIEKIATWFKRSGKTHSDFKLNFLINIICTNVQKSYPLKNLTLSGNCDFCETIKGEYYEHFNDFIRIFVDNMLKHSINSNINSNISIKTFEKHFEMILENDSPNSDYDIPVEDSIYGTRLDGIKLITEGKSGLVKAVKTIKDDLKNDNNQIFFLPTKDKFKVTIIIHYTDLIV